MVALSVAGVVSVVVVSVVELSVVGTELSAGAVVSVTVWLHAVSNTKAEMATPARTFFIDLVIK